MGMGASLEAQVGLGSGAWMGGVVFFFLGWWMAVSDSSSDSHASGGKGRAAGLGLPLRCGACSALGS